MNVILPSRFCSTILCPQISHQPWWCQKTKKRTGPLVSGSRQSPPLKGASHHQIREYEDFPKGKFHHDVFGYRILTECVASPPSFTIVHHRSPPSALQHNALRALWLDRTSTNSSLGRSLRRERVSARLERYRRSIGGSLRK